MSETKRPMVITKHGRPVAAIVEIGELQRLYDLADELEQIEDRQVIVDFEAAEARGEIEWVSDEEMAQFIAEMVANARQRVEH